MAMMRVTRYMLVLSVMWLVDVTWAGLEKTRDGVIPASVAGAWSGTTCGFGAGSQDSSSVQLTLTQIGAGVAGSYTIIMV